MSPVSSPRHLWVWSLPSLALLLSLVWFKRRRHSLRADSGGTAAKSPPDAADEVVDDPRHADDRADDEAGAASVPRPAPTLDSAAAAPGESPAVQPAEQVAADRAVESTTPAEDTEPVTHAAPADPAEPGTPAEPATLAEPVVVAAAASAAETSPVEDKECEEVVAETARHPVTLAEDDARSDSADAVPAVSATETDAPTSAGKMKETKEEGCLEATAPAVAAVKDAKHEESENVAALEGKLASLALGSSEERRRDAHGAERDSANHSPVDAMLASPSMSSYSDEHSEGSSDSGKGCSDVASPPSRTPVGSGSLAGDADVDTGVESASSYSVYEFLLPPLLVGRLIGRNGAVVHEIKNKTNARIWVKKHPKNADQRVCTIEGNPADIDNALAMIRKRFPLHKNPGLTLEQISLAPVPTVFPLVPDFCQLHLVEGVNNEVMISSLVSPAHMFVQQPYHPSYQFLQKLNHMMNSVYSRQETPCLPSPIEAGNICVAPAIDGWYRAQVVSSNEETQTSEIKFVDYGGYMVVSNSVLRQIRQDFMTLPFQATECYLANIKPSGESGEWVLDALRIVEELTRGQMLLAQVYDYAADGVPLIYLYSFINSQVVLINQELVARGMADVDDSAFSTSSEAASLVVAAKAVAVAAANESSGTIPTESSTTAESDNKSVTVESSLSSQLAAD